MTHPIFNVRSLVLRACASAGFAACALVACHAPSASAPAEVERAYSTAAARSGPDTSLPPGVQGYGVDGRALFASALSSVERAKRSAALDEARERWEAAPDDPDALIWVGRRLGYLWRMREAIDVFTIGVQRFPEDARMLRHRGHRYISVREFERAERDLARAARLVRGQPDEVEPDGIPNASGAPLETLQSNIHYHLALARHLSGDWAGAEQAWRACLAVSKNADNRSSASHWLHIALRRQGKLDEARRVLEPIVADLPVREYHGYFQLCRAYQGARDMDELYDEFTREGGIEGATVGYGVGAWHLDQGRRERALEIFRELANSDARYAFGAIAAEVELARAAQR